MRRKLPCQHAGMQVGPIFAQTPNCLGDGVPHGALFNFVYNVNEVCMLALSAG
jgi:hypothetical protein